MTPSPPTDLLRPLPGSTTTRALLSLVRRTRFEAWKAYVPTVLPDALPNALEDAPANALPTALPDAPANALPTAPPNALPTALEHAPPSALPDAVAHDLAAVRATLERFLFGDPHTVVRVLVLPTVGAALRRVVGGALAPSGERLAPDPSALPELCSSIALALAIERALPAPIELMTPTAVTLLAADAALFPEGPIRFEPSGECTGGRVVRGIARATPLGAVVGADAVDLERLEHARAAFARAHPGASETSVRLARELVDEDADWLPLSIGRLACPRLLAHVRARRPEPSHEAYSSLVTELAREHARHLLAALSEVDALADRPAVLVDAALRFVATGTADDEVREALDGLIPTEVGAGLVEEMLRG